MPNIYSISFDTLNWHKTQVSTNQILWDLTPAETFGIEFKQPTDFKRDLADPNVRLQFEEVALHHGGVLIDFEVSKIKGLEVAKQIYKYWYPVPRDMRKVYIGTLAFPFAEFCYILKIQCIETGTTGTREAAIALALSGGKPEQPKQEPIVVKSMDELLERMKQAPLKRLPADDEQHDKDFPQHPLTKVRGYLKHIAETLTAEPELLQAKPYRVAQKSEGLINKFRNFFTRG